MQISLSIYCTFEREGKGSFENFIAILGGLGALGELDKLLKMDFFTLEEFRETNNKKPTLRVRKSKSPKEIESASTQNIKLSSNHKSQKETRWKIVSLK